MAVNGISIRLAAPGDAAGWVHLKQQVHHIHVRNKPERFTSITDEEAYAIFEHLLQEEGTQVWVAETPTGDIAGEMAIKTVVRERHPGIIAGKYLLIDEICVDEKCRSLGIGRLLTEKAMAIAESEGLESVTLQVWEFNQEALAFYRSIGMQADMLRLIMPVKRR